VGEALNHSPGLSGGSPSPEPTAGCPSKCLVKAQRVSISSRMCWFESSPLTSTAVQRPFSMLRPAGTATGLNPLELTDRVDGEHPHAPAEEVGDVRSIVPQLCGVSVDIAVCSAFALVAVGQPAVTRAVTASV